MFKELREQIKEIFKDWWDKRDMMSLDHLKQEADRVEKDVLALLYETEQKLRQLYEKRPLMLPNEEGMLEVSRAWGYYRRVEQFLEKLKEILGEE